MSWKFELNPFINHGCLALKVGSSKSMFRGLPVLTIYRGCSVQATLKGYQTLAIFQRRAILAIFRGHLGIELLS